MFGRIEDFSIDFAKLTVFFTVIQLLRSSNSDLHPFEQPFASKQSRG